MSQTANKPVEVGVVLQGGGALGAYECGALNALLELIDEFSAKGHRILLKVVSGVSIGSSNAACVVGAKSNADACVRLNAMWDDVMLETPPFWMHAAQRDPAYVGQPRHVLASGSLPPGCPWTEIDGMPHWDGGLVDNTPLGLAIDAFSNDAEADRMLVVMNLYPLRARLPRNLAVVEDRMHELSFGNRLRQDHDTARRVNALVETIEDLAALVPPEALNERLRARLDEARRYKIIDAIV